MAQNIASLNRLRMSKVSYYNKFSEPLVTQPSRCAACLTSITEAKCYFVCDADEAIASLMFSQLEDIAVAVLGASML